jgi:hypothetical protein
MAAFVDGEVNPSEGVDLGPLVGVQRGFKTKEKVPFSGGMSGVEMWDGDKHDMRRTVAPPLLTLSTPRRYRDKGKGRAMTVDDHDSEPESPLASGQEDMGPKR